MNFLKVFLLNLMVLCTFLTVILFTPPIAFYVYFFFKYGIQNAQSVDERTNFEIYNEYEWAVKHYKEFDKLDTCYKDFYVWRRCDFKGQTINVIDGIRKTKLNGNKNSNFKQFDQISFFGGSTVWGTGVNDLTTLPSMFVEETNNYTINYGESGYISLQELSLLQNLYLEDKLGENNLIIFYDGINEVLARCRKDYKGLVTAQYEKINGILEKNKILDNKYSFRKLFLQVEMMLVAISKRIYGYPDENYTKNINKENNSDVYDCDEDQLKAEKIAKQLVDIWSMANNLTKLKGDKIISILQPVAYVGKPKIDYLNLTSSYHKEQADQYLTVYPLIKKYAKKHNIKYYDLTNIYDDCEICYVDQFHVGPQAHKLLAKKIVNIVEAQY